MLHMPAIIRNLPRRDKEERREEKCTVKGPLPRLHLGEGVDSVAPWTPLERRIEDNVDHPTELNEEALCCSKERDAAKVRRRGR